MIKSDMDGWVKKVYSHPLISIDEERNQLPHAFATATIACVQGRFFLVTPAHALEPMAGKPVYLSVDPTSFSLAGKKIIKTSDVDIAAVELTDAEIDQVFQTAVIVTSEMVVAARELKKQENSIPVLEGYPANRNKMKIRNKLLTRNMVQITFASVAGDYFPDERYSEPMHFAYEYNEKNLLDEEFNKTKPRQLAGMSGGMFKVVNELGLELPLGIFLAQDKGKPALIGLDYDFILKWLEFNIDQF
ncbi:hypothetical protein A1OK_19490 [Enterovibrio norvegicus FF-454]|uniref:Trypsin n=1 Tax=Enterovibrio norvegicus FF-454 TaxID=1185651 RepID=A0A1E5CB70_9GAMM|nr:hypothetical protein [Enterovibrio norvegicus]OEE62773.1 hypothetical protein A1OK_19490 [Enterovibrio norvegicus FF-454]